MLLRLYLQDKKTNKALEQVNVLLELNQSNKEYYYQVLECKGIDYKDPGNIKEVVEVFETYEQKYPKQNATHRIVLKLAPVDSPIYKETLIKYMKPQLIKGVPSMVNDMKIFYSDQPEKAAIIG